MLSRTFFKANSKKAIIFLLIVTVFLGIILILSLVFFDREKKQNLTGIKHNADINANEENVSVADFYLEDSYSPLFESRHYPLRPKHQKWSEGQVEKYYIPLDKIITDIFEENNDNNIKKLFENIE